MQDHKQDRDRDRDRERERDRDQEPPPIPKRCNNFVPPSLPSREQNVRRIFFLISNFKFFFYLQSDKKSHIKLFEKRSFECD